MSEKIAKLRVGNELRRSVLAFALSGKEYKKMHAQIALLKEQFYADADDYFDRNEGSGKSVVVEYDGAQLSGKSFTGRLTINRVQKTKITFIPERIELALNKELSSKVVTKRYEVVNMSGLISYLREFGVDPKVFKSFISVTKEVDSAALERLEEVGKITRSQIEGCYEVESQSPYYTVKVDRVGDLDES